MSLFSIVSVMLYVSFFPAVSGASYLEVSRAALLSVFAGMILVSLSRRLMYSLRSDLSFKMAHYFLWCAGEILVTDLVLTALAFALPFMSSVLPEDETCAGFALRLLPYALFCMGIPDLLYVLVLSMDLNYNTLRLTDYSGVVSDVNVPPHEEQRITLYDNNGNLKLSVNSDNLYFFESDDNYIKVWYTGNGEDVRQYMLRCRLKTIEESFSDTSLVRCHRKYIVNINKVSVVESGKDGYLLDLGLSGVSPIPVSRTYEKSVLARFNSR